MENKQNKWFDWYRIYLQSDEWAWVRDQVFKRDKRCLRCNNPYKANEGFECHHLNYKHVGDADINEVESCCTLCKVCHWTVHNPGKNYVEHLQKQIEKYLN
jgi:hypothetical protein